MVRSSAGLRPHFCPQQGYCHTSGSGDLKCYVRQCEVGCVGGRAIPGGGPGEGYKVRVGRGIDS